MTQYYWPLPRRQYEDTQAVVQRCGALEGVWNKLHNAYRFQLVDEDAQGPKRKAIEPDGSFAAYFQMLILDTRPLYLECQDRLKRLPCYEDADWDAVLGESLEYLADLETSFGNILEYAETIRNVVSKEYDEPVITEVYNALKDFAVQLFEHLQAIKAYEGQALNWSFKEFFGGDMIVYRVE